MIEWIKDKYLTWRTGKDKDQRDWEAWYETNVNYRSVRIKDMFRKFEYVLEVDWQKFLEHNDPFAWVPVADAVQYFWPTRPLGENAVWRIERVMKAPATAYEWEINELGGEDKVFVATNNQRDAVMIALKYT